MDKDGILVDRRVSLMYIWIFVALFSAVSTVGILTGIVSKPEDIFLLIPISVILAVISMIIAGIWTKIEDRLNLKKKLKKDNQIK
jgi:putative Ca2+/H+ antiporter (TMEM165/GDT1 family)